MYMRQEQILRRVAEASVQVGGRALVLTGMELAPEEIAWPEGVIARCYVPHRAVLAEAALVVNHAGMGTLMAAFAAGVPSICIPLGRDQLLNAQRAEELGAAVTVSPDASPAELRAQISAALRSTELVAGAHEMARSIEHHQNGAQAVAAIEGIAPHAVSKRPSEEAA